MLCMVLFERSAYAREFFVEPNKAVVYLNDCFDILGN